MNNDILDLTKLVKDFVNERDWDQFHNPKDLALALSIEAAELNELFLWKSPEEANNDRIAEELADVFIYALLMASKCNLDVADIVRKKIAMNADKYPAAKAKGNSRKYNEL